jgi:ketosteroid isomerase-like protein
MTELNTALDTLMRFYEAETAYLAPDGGDFRVIAAMLDPECVLYQPRSLPYGGEWRGHEGFEKWMQKLGEQWSSLEVKDPELYPSGDVVISRSQVYAVARATGHRIDWPLLQFFKVRNGKILELRPFHWDTAAMLPAMRKRS